MSIGPRKPAADILWVLKIINRLASLKPALIHIYFQVCLLVQQEEISESMAPKDIFL